MLSEEIIVYINMKEMANWCRDIVSVWKTDTIKQGVKELRVVKGQRGVKGQYPIFVFTNSIIIW